MLGKQQTTETDHGGGKAQGHGGGGSRKKESANPRLRRAVSEQGFNFPPAGQKMHPPVHPDGNQDGNGKEVGQIKMKPQPAHQFQEP